MMNPNRLVTACLATAMLPAAAIAQPLGAEDYILYGLVRDMSPTHPDFVDVSPDAYTRIAGLVEAELAVGTPALSGDGKELTSPARDSEGNFIPPHLAVEGAGASPGETGIRSESPVILQDNWETDSWAISLQSVTYNPDGTSTWVYHVAELPGGRDLSHWNLELDPSHKLMPGTTPGYERGHDGSTGFVGIKWNVTDQFTAADFTIVLDKWYEAGIWPDNVLAKGGPGFDTDEILAPGTGVGTPGSGPEGCLDLNDILATYGLPHDGAMSMYFVTWFRSVPGYNRAESRSVLMRWNEDTQSWRYRSEDFRPIDGALYGAATPKERNGTFTLAVDARFDFTECDGRFFELACDGDAWVFINGKLVIDLGGLQQGDRQYLELDRLEDLETGVGHRLMIFYAHRSDEAAQFEIHTNLHLRTFSAGTAVAPLAD